MINSIDVPCKKSDLSKKFSVSFEEEITMVFLFLRIKGLFIVVGLIYLIALYFK